MPETPLPSPSSVPYRVQQRESYLTAYNMLLRLEGTILVEIKHATVTKDKSQREDDLMYCRIVGHFFHHVASYTGLSNLVLEFDLQRGRTPAQYRHPSRPSFDSLTDMIKSMLKEAPTNHETAKKKAILKSVMVYYIICLQMVTMSLTNILVMNFEPNLTAHIQPNDQGIICCFKAHYRAGFIRREGPHPWQALTHNIINATDKDIFEAVMDTKIKMVREGGNRDSDEVGDTNGDLGPWCCC
ncbi:hypothetical protein V8E55_008597 [Tylopilus felleus]